MRAFRIGPRKLATAASLAIATGFVFAAGGGLALTIAVGLILSSASIIAFLLVDTRRAIRHELLAIRTIQDEFRETIPASKVVDAPNEARDFELRHEIHRSLADERQQAVRFQEDRAIREAEKWEDALWSGHKAPAIDRLQRLARDHSVSTRARSRALLALAKWNAHVGDFASAYENSVLARVTHPGGVRADDEQPALEADFLAAIGRRVEARELVLQLPHADDPNLLLRLANLHEDDARLGWLNELLCREGFAPIGRRDRALPLTIDNLKTRHSLNHNGQVSTATVSVIMPALNAAGTIATALRSLQEQTWGNLEVIVVDDGSSDTTVEIAQDFASRDPRIHVLPLERNYGVYTARNFGLRHVSGEIVTTHDADDWSHAQKIEAQVRSLLADETLVGTMSYATRVSEDLVAMSFSKPRKQLITLNSSSIMVLRRVFDEIGFWDEVRASADSEFLFRMRSFYGKEAVSLVHREAPLMFARFLDGSLTSAVDTGIFTLWAEGGARRQYKAAYTAWHKDPEFKAALPWNPRTDPRPFPCPPELRIHRESVAGR